MASNKTKADFRSQESPRDPQGHRSAGQGGRNSASQGRRCSASQAPQGRRCGAGQGGGCRSAKAEGGETAAAAPKNYSRGEGQKPVTQAYKDNWNAIFGNDEEEEKAISRFRLPSPSRLRPQQPPDHLAGGGHRHLVDEGDLARIFVRRQMRAHERLDVAGERVRRASARISAR